MGLGIWLESDGIGSDHLYNATGQWEKAGCYKTLYDSQGELAGDHIDILCKAINTMLLYPEEFQTGYYEADLDFLCLVARLFSEHPNSKICVSK